MDQKKKKIIVPLVITIVVVAIIGIIVFSNTADPTKKMTKDEMLKVAEFQTVTYFRELKDNTALAETQKGKIFKISGKIYNIAKDHVEITDSDTMLKMYLPKDELITLKKDQYITIVGSLNKVKPRVILAEKVMFFEFKNCYLLD